MIRFSITALALCCTLTGAAPAQAQAGPAPATFGFLTHAAFFSVEAKLPNLVDPHVFAADANAAAATGPQGIMHASGYRPAFGVDDPSIPLSNADGKPLGLTLEGWFSARGTVMLSATATGDTIATLAFTGLVRGGRYSMFENHFALPAVTFTPLDGSAKANSFTAAADGSAHITLTIPGRVTHAEGILLVYHSDGVDHGQQRGQIGVTAHHQLIVRVP